jgi:hypothetical protein
MKNFGFATIAATALTAGALGLAAPALAVPTGSGDAQDTISSLEDQGYRVIVNRLGMSPMSEATVVSVGEGPAFSHNVAADGSSSDYSVPVTTRTVYVNIR